MLGAAKTGKVEIMIATIKVRLKSNSIFSKPSPQFASLLPQLL